MDRYSLILALSYCDFLKTHEKLSLLKSFSSIKELASSSIVDLSFIINRRLKTNMCLSHLLELVERGKKVLDFYSIRMLMIEDQDFPYQLKEIADPPFVVFIRGVMPNVGFNMISIVGTRRPTGDGLNMALKLGAECASLNLPLVSGFARGIDSFSQRSCVAKKGLSIAVLPCGVERIYPASNKSLAQKIIANSGCLLSEYPPFTNILKFRFPQRNRLISGLSRYLLVIEAPNRSGALITADFALDQGRDVFVCKDILNSQKNEGCRKLYEDGAKAISSILEIINE